MKGLVRKIAESLVAIAIGLGTCSGTENFPSQEVQTHENLERKVESPSLQLQSIGIIFNDPLHHFFEQDTIARSNWDHYNTIRNECVNEFVIAETDKFVVGEAYEDGRKIFLYERNGANVKYDASTIIHEMGHLWYMHLSNKGEFATEYVEITGQGYLPLTEKEEKSLPAEVCISRQRDLAAVSCYGTESIDENVARDIEFVYIMKTGTDEEIMEELEKVPVTEIGRVKKKIMLLYRYGAFSKEEMNIAQSQLDKYDRVYQFVWESLPIGPLRSILKLSP